MSKFKAGDKVKVIKAEDYYWYNNHIGEVFTLMSGPDQEGDWRIQENVDWRIQENVEHYLAECDIELVCANKQLVQEKEDMQFDMHKQPWFIRVNNKEEYNAASEWLYENFGNYANTGYASYIVGLTNTDNSGEIHPRVMWMGEDSLEATERYEIKLSYKTVVDSVTFPEMKTEQQKKIEELEATIAQAQAQLAQLKQQINKGE